MRRGDQSKKLKVHTEIYKKTTIWGIRMVVLSMHSFIIRRKEFPNLSEPFL
jgi:hypothetical protein